MQLQGLFSEEILSSDKKLIEIGLMGEKSHYSKIQYT